MSIRLTIGELKLISSLYPNMTVLEYINSIKGQLKK